jgi:hypothetical protein
LPKQSIGFKEIASLRNARNNDLDIKPQTIRCARLICLIVTAEDKKIIG